MKYENITIKKYCLTYLKVYENTIVFKIKNLNVLSFSKLKFKIKIS